MNLSGGAGTLTVNGATVGRVTSWDLSGLTYGNAMAVVASGFRFGDILRRKGGAHECMFMAFARDGRICIMETDGAKGHRSIEDYEVVS